MDPVQLGSNFVISDLPNPHKDIPCDLLIVGSGPVGMTYARLAIQEKLTSLKNVVILECGGIDSSPPASHKKNEVVYQKDIDLFTGVIMAALEPASVPEDPRYASTVSPDSWNSNVPFRQKGQNPNQIAAFNLGAAAVARSVGGMATHWTCAVPRLTGKQRPDFKGLAATQWNELYSKAEEFIGKNKDEVIASKDNPFGFSIRHYVVHSALNQYNPSQLPLAVSSGGLAPSYLTWSSPYTIIKPALSTSPSTTNETKVTLYTHALCVKLNKDMSSSKVESVTVKNLLNTGAADFSIKPKCIIVAAGAILGPQLLVKSGLAPYRGDDPTGFLIPNLGMYLTEQTIAFCQIILRQDIIDSLRDPYDMPIDMKVTGDGKWPTWVQEKLKDHMAAHKLDPIPIPFADREPQITIPYSDEHPWHSQIHRDAFSYGALAPTVDSRLVVDLRFFGEADPRAENTLTFEKEVEDGYGMPQPTFHYSLRDGKDAEARKNNREMAKEMSDVASKLGGFLPGSAPRFMEPGLALHIGGVMRMGDDETTSVVDTNCRVHKLDNLYLAGNGVIPTAFAANPTLTSMALAIRSWEDVKKVLIKEV